MVMPMASPSPEELRGVSALDFEKLVGNVSS